MQSVEAIAREILAREGGYVNDPDDPGELPLSEDIATLTTGTTIEVDGIVTGTFAPEGETASGANGDEVELSANLTSMTSAIGEAEFEREYEDGAEEKKFEVEIANAAASTTFDVSIDGMVVGQITTNAQGYGKLEFNSNPDEPDEQAFPMGFTDPMAGAVIDVGGVLTGTLA